MCYGACILEEHNITAGGCTGSQDIAIATLVWTFSWWCCPSNTPCDPGLSSPTSVPCWHRPETLVHASFQRERFSHSALFSFFGPLSGRQLEWVVELELLLSLLLQRHTTADEGVQRALLRGSRMPRTLGGDQGLLPTPMPRSVDNDFSSLFWVILLFSPR